MSRFSFVLLFVCLSLAPLQGMHLEHLKTPEQTPLRGRPKVQKIDLSDVMISPATLKALLRMVDEEVEHVSNYKSSDTDTDFPSEKSFQGASTIKRRSQHGFFDESDAAGTTPFSSREPKETGLQEEHAQEGLRRHDVSFALASNNSSTQSMAREQRVDLLELFNDHKDSAPFYEGNLEESQYGYLEGSANIEQESSVQADGSHAKGQLSDYGFLADQSVFDFALFFPLYQAVDAGDISLVVKLIAQEADLELKNAQGKTPLHIAVEAGSKELCETLLNAGAKVNVQDALGYTPLHTAASRGFTDILVLLLVRDAELDVRSLKGWTPLHCACWYGQAEAAALLLTSRAPLEVRCEGGNTPLHFATWRDEADLSKLLIYCGASILRETTLMRRLFIMLHTEALGKLSYLSNLKLLIVFSQLRWEIPHFIAPPGVDILRLYDSFLNRELGLPLIKKVKVHFIALPIKAIKTSSKFSFSTMLLKILLRLLRFSIMLQQEIKRA